MKVAILGVTGAVGMQMLKCIEERNIKVDVLKLLASEKSAGKILKYKGNDIKIEKTDKESFRGMDVVLGAVQNPFAKEYAPYIVKSGAVFIDNSSAFRMEKKVPLVVPEINQDDIKTHQGIIANPNCSTIITMMAIYPIQKLSPITKLIATTFQAVSGAGVQGIRELKTELKDLIESCDIDDVSGVERKLDYHNAFPYQIAYNVIPSIGSPLENLYTTEEMKMQNEGRKILHNDNMKVTCTCVRVPVMRSHSISVSLSTEKELDLNVVRESIKNSEGLKLVDDIANASYPMPLEICDKDVVEVGRIRKDLVLDNGIALFTSGDQIRKGAATNAVEIMERL